MTSPAFPRMHASSPNRSRLARSTRSPAVLALLALAAAASAAGCGHHPGVTQPCTPQGAIAITKIRVTSIDKVDLLVMIDNSASMADKSNELARRLPELIKSLTDPDLDAAGQPKTQRVADLHVGVISSSLGSHGTSACDPALHGAHSDDHGHLLPRAGENGTRGYTVDAAGGTPVAVACPSPVAASALTWAYDPSRGAQFSGVAQAKSLEAAVSCVVQSAGEDGCGYEAPLESVYHFLVDPAPYLTADVSCTKSPTGDACGSNKITPTGVDAEILKERAAFLRPDSLLAVLMLTDENDGSILPAGLNWLPLAYGKGTMLRGWSGCESVPDDIEPQSSADYAALWSTYKCISCFQKSPDGTTDPNCSAPWAATPLNADVDGANLRMLQNTRRYGYNFLWGRQRYVDAFSASTVVGSDGKIAPNPIYSGGFRTKDLVLVAGLLGVPKTLLPTDADGTGKDLTESDWDKIVSPDPAKRDPHMLEQIAPRAGIAKYAGDRGIDPVNGGDRDVTDGDDLQYACIAPRDPSLQAAPATSAECGAAGASASNPLCGPDAGGHATQPYFKAYPTLRQLRVLHELQQVKVPTMVASLCTDSDSPAMQGLVAKLQAALTSNCIKSVLFVDAATGATTCTIVQVFATANPKGAALCEELSGGHAGYCTPGAAPCRYATDSNGKPTGNPPVAPDVAAAQLVIDLTITDPATGAATTEAVKPVADPDGNVYAIGSDGKKHLVCEARQLAGNPGVPAAEQTGCLQDPAYTLADGSGGWCYSTQDALVGARCKAAGAVGTIRYLGSVQPGTDSEMFTLCQDPTATGATGSCQ